MKLLALVESPDHVCCRYRIRPFASFLSDAGWSVVVSKVSIEARCFVPSIFAGHSNSTR